MTALSVDTTKPAELGTAVITMAFTDEDGNTVVPTSLEWQLMRSDGTVINENTFSEGSFTGTTVVLSGNDLAYFGSSDNAKRIFSVQGVYDSNAGTDLPLNAELRFEIQPLTGQTDAS